MHISKYMWPFYENMFFVRTQNTLNTWAIYLNNHALDELFYVREWSLKSAKWLAMGFNPFQTSSNTGIVYVICTGFSVSHLISWHIPFSWTAVHWAVPLVKSKEPNLSRRRQQIWQVQRAPRQTVCFDSMSMSVCKSNFKIGLINPWADPFLCHPAIINQLSHALPHLCYSTLEI